MPHPPPRLTMGERLVLEDLRRESAKAKGAEFPYPAAAKVAELDISPNTLSRSLRRFRALGLIESSTITAPGRPIRILLTLPQETAEGPDRHSPTPPAEGPTRPRPYLASSAPQQARSVSHDRT